MGLPAGKEIREESWRKHGACGARFSIPGWKKGKGIDKVREAVRLIPAVTFSRA